ncbi:pyruvate/2-oxoglutarate dehydrogenase complex, dihydrolipoamide dehydrogenase component [Halogeometricum borinquense DSM 11551]|uniref:Pyruvate/2-oxoglutarate dehydrogenase complex, dihydrolipoamide dehydrogenase component n=1 Tax=Halogeometricum borinquense (strain ATCC 700274 / DSM 11551 / JCM 10706 / KCTC 4070 / PR3) TaxID=469382 RepID=E4NTB8_HALBP|nr:NAD(P)/FAD-dependent oxidoreductase [Halogeometricum borinquense]ADQ68215.1 pyruvate/2-oxoglutarate dehydrogenase complex, dihydrolipoamide dehydrogenase component [Halogeometricum borinquense DSM 11551]ELY24741.1 pyruvate/2-oxoglutarate dehydrogenase complex, dihydrolipoamide dehydrogenase component [Halogeometricum borinquense DSM 11551]
MTHVAIVGAYGSAGVAVADRLVEHVGAEIDRLTLVDDGEPGGGLCILRGCMPSKEVLSTAAHRYQMRHDHRLVGEPPEMDLEAVVETKNEHTSNFASHRRTAVHRMEEREGVAFRHETARFVDDRTLLVGDERIEADYVVVATGSSLNIPDLPGIGDVDYNTSADVLDATTLPDSGVVMGFGYIGLELVPYLSEAGVDLTVIEHDERPVDEGDPEYGDEILSMYREEFGVEIRTETRERRVERTDDGVRLHVEGPDGEDAIDAEALFLFTGRRPTLDGLELEAAGITPTGEEWVRNTMQTRADDNVYVVGDANGKEPILHVAKEQGHVAAENILADVNGGEHRTYENIHHHVIFSGASVYPYARVGHSVSSAEEAGLNYVAVHREASDDGVFKTKLAPRGRATLVVGTDGAVLGFQGLHYHADVMAKTMQVAVENEMDVRKIPDRAYHPTTPEILDGLLRSAAERLE